MSWNPFAIPDDPADPIRRSFNHFKRRFRNVLLVVIASSICILAFGVPSIQWNYRTYSTQPSPSAHQKINADYWNPIGGWRVVNAGELGPGCPIVVLMPLRLCMDLTPYKTRFTLFVFGEEFFDET